MKSALVNKLAVVFTVVAAVVGYTTSVAHAASIGLNITYNTNNAGANSTDATIMSATDTTGVVTQAHWNTVTMRDWYETGFWSPVLGIDTTKEGHPTSATLIDSTGAATSVNVKSNVGLNWHDSPDAGLDGYAGSTATEKLLYGYASPNNTTPVVISINGLSNYKYDIYAYFSINTSDYQQTSATLGSTTYYFTVPTGQASSFTQATNTSVGVYTQTGNYVEWSGILPSSGTISFSYTGPGNGAGLAGLEIVDAPEPASLGTLMLGAGALTLRRRRAVR